MQRRNGSRIPGWLSAGIVGGALASLILLERHRPLRRQIEPGWRREARNLAIAVLSAATLRIVEKPVVEPLAEAVEQNRWGLLKQANLPDWLELPIAIALMDYTLYIWHVLTHRVPALWRFHRVHHVDLDLSATTAVRFHFAEMALSVPWRAAQVFLLGISPRPLSVWQTALLVSILFHHSNLRLPIRVERLLVRMIVTPRMHGIHHSSVRDETASNWSSWISAWDWLHGTLKLGIPQQAITIGVPAYRDPQEVTLRKVLEMPFLRQRSTWDWPDSQPRPVRAARTDTVFPSPSQEPRRVSGAPQPSARKMPDYVSVADGIMVGMGEPSLEVIKNLVPNGIRSVLDIRQEGEHWQRVPPSTERHAVERCGMQYAHFPVPTDKLSNDLLARFDRMISRLSKPVFIHCASGKRSGTLALMHVGLQAGHSGQHVLDRAEAAGVTYGSDELKETIKRFVDQTRVERSVI